jgi:hypothetical protein
MRIPQKYLARRHHLGCCGLGQDAGDVFAPGSIVSSSPPVSDLQSQVNALQGQVNATSDVVGSILASSPAVQTSPTDVTSASNTTVYVLIAIVGIMAVIGMSK